VATQWYIRRGSKISSPRDSAQLKNDATTGFVKPTDEVSQSPTGPWTIAQKVKGLFLSEGAAAIRDEPAGQESSSLKPCPFCAENIQAAATKCKHCGEFLSKPQAESGTVFSSSLLSDTEKQRIKDEETYREQVRVAEQTRVNKVKNRFSWKRVAALIGIVILAGIILSECRSNFTRSIRDAISPST